MNAYRPLAMGLLMGPMMLWMIHGQMTGTAPSGWAAAAFIGAHLVILAAVVSGAVFAARMSPRLQTFAARLHRPSLKHFGAMLSGAAMSALAVHFWLHGIA